MIKCKNYEVNDDTCIECEKNAVGNHQACYKPGNSDAIKPYEHVEHPAHYSQNGRRECIEEMRFMFGDYAVMQWCKLTAYKYLYRAGTKPGNSADQDRNKARWYMEYAEKLADIRDTSVSG